MRECKRKAISKWIFWENLRSRSSSIVSEVNKTVFFFYKTYFKPKIHKTIAPNKQSTKYFLQAQKTNKQPTKYVL